MSCLNLHPVEMPLESFPKNKNSLQDSFLFKVIRMHIFLAQNFACALTLPLFKFKDSKFSPVTLEEAQSCDPSESTFITNSHLSVEGLSMAPNSGLHEKRTDSSSSFSMLGMPLLNCHRRIEGLDLTLWTRTLMVQTTIARGCEYCKHNLQ